MADLNLLFLFTDEQRYDTMAAYGNDLIQTPNLNRLAAESFVFERAYVTQPVCTPSRASILTGLYPHTCGCVANNVPLPEDILCLPEMLGGGYATAYHGKWHLGDEIFAQHGFQEWRAIEDQYRSYYRPGRPREALSHYQKWLIEDKGLKPPEGSDYFGRAAVARLPEQYSKPAYLAQEACRFIRQNRTNPFVLFVNFLEPHMPFFGPRDGQHDPARVPLLLRLPGQTAARRIRHPVSQIDLVPTLLDLMGRPVPGHLQGFSLRRVLEDGAAPQEPNVFIEWNALTPPPGAQESPQNGWQAQPDPVCSVVSPEGWKLNWSALGEHELYDLCADPGERANLARRPEVRTLMRALASRIRRWQERTGDALSLPPL